MACRLILLDKEPGLRPRDVGYFIINIILTEAHCSYFFSGFPGHLFLFYTCDNCQLAKRDNGWRMGGGGIHTFGTKVLNFLELPERIYFFYIYGIHILVSVSKSCHIVSI